MSNEFIKKLLKPNIIDLALSGDENALSEIFKHYQSLILENCKKKYYDNNGIIHYYYDEDKEQKIKEHLTDAIKRYEF